MKKKRRSDCPIAFNLDLVGDKWSLLIIRDMIFGKKQYYSDFLSSDEQIATNILADRLAMLEREKIIQKSVDPGNKSRFIYTLTQKGSDLFPIMVEMILWSYKYDKKTTIPADFINTIIADKSKFMSSILNKYYNTDNKNKKNIKNSP